MTGTLRERLLSTLRSNGLVRSAGILVGGTASAHLITAISLPLVTRLYDPSEMDALAIFSSFAIIFGVTASLRFDVAVSMPENDEDALNLLALGCLSALAVTAAIAVAVALVPARAYQAFDHPELKAYMWLLAPAVLLTALYSLFQFWFVRRKAFRAIAQSRVLQSAGAASTQLGLGFANLGPLGLFLGMVVNSGAGSVTLGLRFLRQERLRLRVVSVSRMRRLLHEYRRFPTFSAFEAFTNAAGVQLPVVLIAAWAVGPEAGFLALALLVIQAPMALIGTAVGQVFLSEAPQRHRAGEIGAFTVSVIEGLLKAGAGPLLAIAILGPVTFGLLFGPEWSRAGWLITWMTPWFILQLLVVPVLMALQVTHRQRTAFFMQFVGMAGRIGAVAAAHWLASGWISEAYALSGFAFYLAMLAVILHAVGANWADLHAAVRRAVPILLLWIAAAAIGAMGLITVRQLL